jgi:HlyD family secretion protein
MTKKKIVIAIISYLSLSIFGAIIYKKYFKKPQALPFTTENPERRTIRRIIDTTGKISIAKKIKIGSLVTGTLKKLYAKENEWVKKGQLLAEIDTGKDDADVREAEGSVEQTRADYNYYQAHYPRQKVLYQSGQLAKDAFESIERDYHKSKGAYLSAQAQLYKANRSFQDTKIFAPQDGIIIEVGISEGERVTTDLDATILFSIAKDITKMEAYLEIDESNVGDLKIGQKVKFTVDSFPNKKFKSVVKEIAYSPTKSGSNIYYEAIIDIDNREKLLRPGFTVNAKISIAKVKEALAITSHAFMISPKILKEIAAQLGYGFNPIKKEEFKLKEKSTSEFVQTAWVVQENGEPQSFVEKIVTTNITDDIYYEVTSGLNENDNVIVDVEEENYLEKVYKKAFASRF